jgi:arabinose-5-phosphate isomerase
VIVEFSEKRLGTTAVVEDHRLIGIITDGDIRRMLEKNTDIKSLTASDVMSADPIQVESETMAVKALDIMEDNNITQILVTENGKYVGVVHFHDLLKEGII